MNLKADGIQVIRQRNELVSLDVLFQKRRIWSITVDRDGESWFPWPPNLRERLYGRADVEVRDSGCGELHAAAKLQFDASNKTFTLEDQQGRPLMINKWSRLSPMLADGEQTDRRASLLKILVKMRDTLLEHDYQVFAVGGTALGPYRDGDFLPHDDDGDLAVFFETDQAVDVARQMLKLERKLRELGFRVRTHSHAHLQIYVSDPSVDSKLYVDIFAAFLKDGTINQPFPVRAPFRRDQLLPFGAIEVRGESFPVARDIEAWFEINYGESWATPQPGFSFTTPSTTFRRFSNWFGSYNLHRHFWELGASEGHAAQDYKRLSFNGTSIAFRSSIIVNLGSGIDPLLPSTTTSAIRDPTIYALDYADSVRDLAARSIGIPDSRVRVRDVNLANYHAVLSFVALLPAKPFDLYAGFVIEGQDRVRRNNAFWRFARMALLSGGQVVIDHLDTISTNYYYHDPRSWHLGIDRIQAEAAKNGLTAECQGRGTVRVAGEIRSYTRSVLSRSERLV